MASKQSNEGEESYPRPLRPEPGDRDDDGDVVKAAELVLLAHDRCLTMSDEEQGGTGLATTVEETAYAEARQIREDALRKLIEMRARGRRGLSAKKLVLAVVVTWLGSEDPNCAHAMRLLDEYDVVMSGGKSGSDPVLTALVAKRTNGSTQSPQPLYEAEDCVGYR